MPEVPPDGEVGAGSSSGTESDSVAEVATESELDLSSCA